MPNICECNKNDDKDKNHKINEEREAHVYTF